MSLHEAIDKIAKNKNMELPKQDIDEIEKQINQISKYLGMRSYHLSRHCNRNQILLRDAKNAVRIEIDDEEMCERMIQFANHNVTRFLYIKKGFSINILNELFNYQKNCPSQILLDLDIYVPFNLLKNQMKQSKSYSMKNETTVFLLCIVQSIIHNILNEIKKNGNKKIKKVIEDFHCHSDKLMVN